MPPTARPATRRAALAALSALALGAALSSCAYYNTLYIARKYYGKATEGAPYRVDPSTSPDLGNINKSIDYSKKLLANYPKSKWVDDAYLLWAKGFLAKNDPLQTINMLQDFTARFPNSPLAHEAVFYRAVALRQARRYTEALAVFDEFLKLAPREALVPYAHLERARTLRSLDRPAEAAAAAGVVVDRWPKSALAAPARIARAEAALAQGDFDVARRDFRVMGLRSRTDDERLGYLLRESECLEAGRKFDEALGLLRGAISHERPPEPPDTTGGRPNVVPQTTGYDRYGRLLIRIGTVQLLSGDAQGALASFRRTVLDYPRTPVSAEAQYRVGYALEIGVDDFDGARVEYGKVKDQFAGSPFVAQASQRQTTLDQLARYRGAGADSSDRRTQGGFLLAEQYLFQLDKPERALAEYAKVATENPGTPWAGKALNAEAWVLSRRLNRSAEAESLLWKVARDYPATEAQLAARDYLERLGRNVPQEWIKLPPEPAPVRDTTTRRPTASPRGELDRPLTRPPGTTPALGVAPGVTRQDSLARAMMARSMFGGSPPLAASGPGFAGRPADSSLAARIDSMRIAALKPRFDPATAAPPGSVAAAPPGSTPAAAPGSLPTAAPRSIPAAPPAATGAKAMTQVAAADTVHAVPPTAPPAAPPPAATSSPATPPAATPAAADTVRAPLPPLEVSPVRPGITYPAGPPRTLGFSRRAGFAPSRESPVLGARPAARDTSAAAGFRAGAVDSLRGPLGRPALADSLRPGAVRDFEPHGGKIQ